MPKLIDLDVESQQMFRRNGIEPKSCEYLGKRCTGRGSYADFCLMCKNGNGIEYGFEDGVGNTMSRCDIAQKFDAEKTR